MSTKSYTLADGTTATVTATTEGVPFNEGMNVLTKAIKAKTEGGAVTTSKLEPTLTVTLQDTTTHLNYIYENGFRYTYNGDGQIFVSGLSVVKLFGDGFNHLADSDELALYQAGYNGTVRQAYTGTGGNFVPGFLIVVHATEGTNYAAKTAWAEYGWFSDTDGTIYEFVHSGTL